MSYFNLENVRKGINAISPVEVSLNRDSSIVKGAETLVHKGRESVKNTYSNISSFFTIQKNKAVDFFKGVRNSVIDFKDRTAANIEVGMNAVSESIAKTKDDIKNGVKTFNEGISNKVNDTRNGIVNTGKVLGEGVQQGINNAKSFASDTTKVVIKNVPIHVAINKDAKIIKAGSEFFKETLPNGIQSVKNGISTYSKSFAEKIQNTKDAVATKVNETGEVIKTTAKNVSDTIYRESPIHVSMNKESAVARLMMNVERMEENSQTNSISPSYG